MQKCISPDKMEVIKLLEAELILAGHTNKLDNEIYIIDHKCAPNTMREIGRLREIAFETPAEEDRQILRLQFDTSQVFGPGSPCRQLIVWGRKSREIIGGYRFILGEDIRIGQTVRQNSHVPHVPFLAAALHNGFPAIDHRAGTVVSYLLTTSRPKPERGRCMPSTTFGTASVR